MSTIPELLDANFTGLSINDFIVRMHFVADKLEQHPAFQEDNLPEYLAKPPKLRQIAEALGQARDAAAGGDRGKIADKKALRDVGQLALSMNGQHVTMLSLHRNDPSLLHNAGYDQKQHKTNVRYAASLLDLTPGLEVKHGPVSGSITVIAKRLKQTATIELQSTDQDPATETSWSSQGIHSKSRIELKALKPANRYHFRARYHADGRTGPWSSTVSIIVL